MSQSISIELAHSESKKLSNFPIETLAELFCDMELCASFNPEHPDFEELYYPYGKTNYETEKFSPLRVLKYMHEELGISRIRLAIRWNLVEDKYGQLDLSYYKPYLDYCKQQGIKISLNLGPFKTMREPEEHPPEHYIETKQINNGDVISASHPLHLFSLNYLNRISTIIVDEYSEIIETVQADNEAFNRFGRLKLSISDWYEIRVSEILMDKFPNAKILINSAGVNNVNRILNLFTRFGLRGLNRLQMGVNYYYTIPIHRRIPIISKWDNLRIKLPTAPGIQDLKKLAENIFEITISEAQFEPWEQADTPGNKFDEFLFLLLRTQNLKPKHQDDLKVYLWGLERLIFERLSGTNSDDGLKNEKLIKRMTKNFKRGQLSKKAEM